MSSFFHWLMEEEYQISMWFQPHCKGFLEMFAQILSLSGLAVIHKPDLLLVTQESDFPLHAWGPAYIELGPWQKPVHWVWKKSSVLFRNSDTSLTSPRPTSGMNTPPCPLQRQWVTTTVDLTNYHKWSLTMFIMKDLSGFKSLELKSRVKLSNKRCC